ncbi:MAG: sugar phosphate isomerase/epimerase [Myxococcota bacterium]|nr:sugar phosphate isomerase/epimerase [Myxococcales bacterium]
MRIGMNLLLWGVEIDSSHLPVLEMLRSAGYDGVEIPVVGQPDAEIAALRRATETLGLAVTTATFIPPEANPISPDAAVRRAALALIAQRIDAAAALGADLLVGALYQAHKVFTGLPPTEDEWRRSADFLRAAGERAAAAGIRLGLEFLNRFEVHLVNTSERAARMVRDVGLASVGVLYDTHHAHIEDPDARSALPAVRGELLHVHASESHRGTLGTGRVDWSGTFEALAAIGYDDWVVVEAFGTRDPGLVAAANVWRNAFESEEQLARDAIGFLRARLRR